MLAGRPTALLLGVTLVVPGIHVGTPALLAAGVVAGALFSLALLAALALLTRVAVHVLPLLVLLLLRVVLLRVLLGHGELLEQMLNNYNGTR